MKLKKNVILNVAKRSEESLTAHMRVRSFATLRMTSTLRSIATKVIEDASQKVHCPKGAEVSVIFIGDAQMRKMNRTYRGKDKTTNVLAFAADRRNIKIAKYKNRDLGDIFISLPEAKREAKRYGWTLRHEIARLALHGFLHLLGYDHVKEREARVMEGIEDKVLAELT